METVIFYLVFIILNILLTLLPRVPLLNFVWGMLGLAFVGYALNDATLASSVPDVGYFSLAVMLTSGLCMLQGALKYHGD